MNDDAFIPTVEEPGLRHDRDGDRWARHIPGEQRDRDADRDVRAAIRAEQSGEYDEDGSFRPSTWSPA